MYRPEYTKQDEAELNFKLIEEYPLGTLLSSVGGEIQSSFLPFIVESKSSPMILKTHLAKANPHWRVLEGQSVMIHFQGPQRYISPTIYVEPDQVPTWNYAVVHVRGTVELISTFEGIEEILNESVTFFEKRNGTHWNYELPEDLRQKLVKAIVGIKIHVTDIKGKFKLSQNRQDSDYQAVRGFLEQSTAPVDQEMLRWMKLSDGK